MGHVGLKETSPKCLIVEDDSFDKKMMYRTTRLAVSGITIKVVSTLQEARTAVRTELISLILLDNSLPDGKGADFAMELALSSKWSDIPIIIVSDWPSPFMWDKASAAGVRRIVTKSDLKPHLITEILAPKNGARPTSPHAIPGGLPRSKSTSLTDHEKSERARV